MRDYDLVCIGCGPAGEKAASQAAYFKRRVAVVERVTRPGGAMVNTGTIPSKALRETALQCSAFRRRPIPGYTCSVLHGLSMPRFMAQRHLVQQQEHDRIESSMDRHGVDVLLGHGRIVDEHTVEVEAPDGERRAVTAEHVLVATGSSPVRPDFVPFDHPAVVDGNGILSLETMPRTLTIVGGGVIGSEYASMFAEIGVSVVLVHPGEEILGFVDAECREHLVAEMREQGIDLRLSTAVEAVQPLPDGRVRVVLGCGTTHECDCLMWALGRQGNTADIGLERVGLSASSRGLITVNEHYRTDVPSIYAAGDVIGFPALAATSMEQGRVAACHMFGIDFKTRVADAAPIGLYTIPPISMVGRSVEQARELGHDPVVGRALYRDNARGRMLGDRQGLLKCVFDRRTRELLGCAIVGEQATELVHLAQAVMSAGTGIDFFIDACFNYPSLSELYKYAAYDALQTIAAAEQRDDVLAEQAKVA